MSKKKDATSDLGRIILEERNRLGWSQDQLRDAMKREGYEISRQTIGLMETGKEGGEASAKRLAVLAKVLDVPYVYLLLAAGVPTEFVAQAGGNSLSMEDLEALKELQAMPRERKWEWIHMWRAARRYARTEPV